jgi:hypothetical protein
MTISFADTTAAVSLTSNIHSSLLAFKAAEGISLQVYPGRPRTLVPPSIWQDRRQDTISFRGVRDVNFMGHTLRTELVALHGLFDSGEAVAQRDAFVDAFASYIRANRDTGLAGPNSVLLSMVLDDVPNYVPDWVPERDQLVYFATLITLEVDIED